jgi:hypothetical protein
MLETTPAAALQASNLVAPSVHRAARALLTLLLAIVVQAATAVATDELRGFIARRRARLERDATLTRTLLLNLSIAEVSAPVRHQIAHARNPLTTALRLLHSTTLSEPDRAKVQAILTELHRR